MKQRDFRGKAGALFMAAMTVIICLQFGREARAADAPDAGQFADKEQLKEFNTNAQDDKKAAKVYFGSNSQKNQEWWLSDPIRETQSIPVTMEPASYTGI